MQHNCTCAGENRPRTRSRRRPVTFVNSALDVMKAWLRFFNTYEQHVANRVDMKCHSTLSADHSAIKSESFLSPGWPVSGSWTQCGVNILLPPPNNILSTVIIIIIMIVVIIIINSSSCHLQAPRQASDPCFPSPGGLAIREGKKCLISF